MKTERNKAIVAAYGSGASIITLAKEYGLTKQAIWSVIVAHKEVEASPLKSLSRRTRRALSRYGITDMDGLRNAVAMTNIHPDNTVGIGAVGWAEIRRSLVDLACEEFHDDPNPDTNE